MGLSGFEALGIVAAGAAAGAINAMLGSGSLITFPTLVAFGYPPVTANIANNIGLVPGSMAGAFGYRRELAGQGARARTLAVGSLLGALTGATLLLRLPSDVFDAVVPVLVVTACILLAAQPALTRSLASRRRAGGRDVGGAALVVTFAAGIYGGYFGAAQGIILVATLGVLVPDAMHRTNALKNVLAGVVNATAALLFVVVAHVAWTAVALIAVGSTVGGFVGGRYGRRVPARLLRPVMVTYGCGVAAYLVLR